MYGGTHVPVGADQLQHLQVASQLVRTFTHRFGHAFPTPRPLIAGNKLNIIGIVVLGCFVLFTLLVTFINSDDGSDRLRSLRDPTKKMSKSDTDPKSRILLSDTDDVIELKIRKAVTDFTPTVSYGVLPKFVASNYRFVFTVAAAVPPGF